MCLKFHSNSLYLFLLTDTREIEHLLHFKKKVEIFVEECELILRTPCLKLYALF